MTDPGDYKGKARADVPATYHQFPPDPPRSTQETPPRSEFLQVPSQIPYQAYVETPGGENIIMQDNGEVEMELAQRMSRLDMERTRQAREGQAESSREQERAEEQRQYRINQLIAEMQSLGVPDREIMQARNIHPYQDRESQEWARREQGNPPITRLQTPFNDRQPPRIAVPPEFIRRHQETSYDPLPQRTNRTEHYNPMPTTPTTRTGQGLVLPNIPMEPRVNRLPDIRAAPAFSGNASEFADWAFSIQRFARNHWADQTERTIINLAGDKLPSVLLPQWATAEVAMTRNRLEFPATLEGFLTHFQGLFGIVENQNSLYRKWEELYQKKDALTFIQKINAGSLKLNPRPSGAEVKRRIFNGLRPALQETLDSRPMDDQPQSLAKWMEWVIQVDTAMYQAQRRGRQGRLNAAQGSSTTYAHSGPEYSTESSRDSSEDERLESDSDSDSEGAIHAMRYNQPYRRKRSDQDKDKGSHKERKRDKFGRYRPAKDSARRQEKPRQSKERSRGKRKNSYGSKKRSKDKRSTQSSSEESSQSSEARCCFTCGKQGHFSRNCPDKHPDSKNTKG
jgi:hypothetical protein